MKKHIVKVYPSKVPLPKTEQFAWKLAEMASDSVAVEAQVVEMIGNRIIDNAAVALAAINRTPVANARTQALCHPREGGATVFGLPINQTFSAEWAT